MIAKLFFPSRETNRRLDILAWALVDIIDALRTLIKEVENNQMTADQNWNDVKAAVARLESVDARVIEFINQLKVKLDFIVKNSPSGPALEDVKAVIDGLNANADELVAAVTDAVAPEPRPDAVVAADRAAAVDLTKTAVDRQAATDRVATDEAVASAAAAPEPAPAPVFVQDVPADRQASPFDANPSSTEVLPG